MITGFFEESIVKRSQNKKLVEIELINLRDFAIDDYGTVDDRPYGGGAGMVLRVEPLYKAIQFAISNKISNSKIKTKIILTSAKGKNLIKKAQEYSQLDHLIIISGHYEGVDERVLDYVDEEISLGDFIMTGGEITTSAIVDSIVRLVPGVLKKKKQLKTKLLISMVKIIRISSIHETRRISWKKVPEIILSGNHKKLKNGSYRKPAKKPSKNDLIY